MRKGALLGLVFVSACGRFGSEDAPSTPMDAGAADGAAASDSGAGTKEIVTLATGAANAAGLVVDETGIYVGTSIEAANATIVYRVALDGGDPVSLSSGKTHCAQVAIDAEDVFSACDEGLFAVPKLGGNLRALDTPPMSALALVGNDVYACRSNASGMAADVIKIGKAGGGNFLPVATNVKHCESLAVAEADIFFGGDVIGHVVVVTNFAVVDPRAARRIVADNDSIYSLDPNRAAVWRTPRTSAAPGALAAAPNGKAVSLGDLAQDATHVYWTVGTSPDGQLVRAEKATGKVEVIADGLHDPYGVFVGAKHVYWTEHEIGTVKRREK